MRLDLYIDFELKRSTRILTVAIKYSMYDASIWKKCDKTYLKPATREKDVNDIIV